MLAPSLFGVAVFLVLPVVVVAWLSLQSWNLIGPIQPVGLRNYAELGGDASFWHSLRITGVFALIVIPLQVGLGLFAAILLTQRLPGSTFFRAVFVLPWIASPFALGVVWSWIFAPTGGLLNTLTGRYIEWLTSPNLVIPAVAAVIVWQYVGYVTLFFVAGLQNIPQHLIDAARIDGAGALRLFWSVKLPLLRPTMFFVLVTSTISFFQLFDQFYALTKGGPFTLTDQGTIGRTDVVGMHIYTEAFLTFHVGKSAVMAVVLFSLLVVITVAQNLYFRKRTVYDLT